MQETESRVLVPLGACQRFSTAYWITSSARCSSDCGIVSPSALAVLRLMTSSKRLGRSTARSAGLDTDTLPRIGEHWAVGHKTTSQGEGAKHGNGRKPVRSRKVGDRSRGREHERGRKDNDRVDASALGSSEGLVEILRFPNLENLEPYCQGLRCSLDGFHLRRRGRRIPQGSDANIRYWRDLLHEFQPLPHQLREIEEYAGDVPAWPREAGDISTFHGVAFEIYRDNGERTGRILRLPERLWPDGEDRLDLESNQLGREGGQASVAAASILPLNGDVLPFNVTGLPKTLKKRREERSELIGSGLIHENANPPDRPRLRLRLGRERRGEEHCTRACQERAAVYHWLPPLS